jgi:hypothetical protein
VGLSWKLPNRRDTRFTQDRLTSRTHGARSMTSRSISAHSSLAAVGSSTWSPLLGSNPGPPAIYQRFWRRQGGAPGPKPRWGVWVPYSAESRRL